MLISEAETTSPIPTSPKLNNKNIKNYAPIIREMTIEDLGTGFHNVLSELHPYPLPTIKDAKDIFRKRVSQGVKTFVLMLPDVDGYETCIGTAAVLIEQKYYGRVAHIEDVVVSKAFRSSGYGTSLINFCLKYITTKKCYKAVLNCKTDLVGFYERLQFHESTRGLRIDIP